MSTFTGTVSRDSVQIQYVEPDELAPEEEPQPGGDVILARWLAVFFGATGLLALVVSRGQWGLAAIIAAAVALLYAQAAAWADRREASQHLSR